MDAALDDVARKMRTAQQIGIEGIAARARERTLDAHALQIGGRVHGFVGTKARGIVETLQVRVVIGRKRLFHQRPVQPRDRVGHLHQDR